MIYILIGVLVYVFSLIYSYKLGIKRHERFLNKTDYGVFWNFLCDINNKIFGISPSYISSKRIGYFLDDDSIK